MYNVTIELAGTKIALNVLYLQSVNKVSDFVSDGECTLSYSSSEMRIIEEKDFLKSKAPNLKFKDWEYEINSIFRDLTRILFEQGIIVFHGVTVVMNNEGYLFTAPSGTGKSTHANLWLDTFSKKARILNGDKTLLKISNNVLYAYGSPWKGKENIGYNGHVRIKAICHIKRSSINSIQEVTAPQDALPWFLQQTVLKDKNNFLRDIIQWYKRIAGSISCYDLYCNISRESVLIAYNKINGN